MVYSIGPSREVTSETLRCDRVRVRSEAWTIQSGSYKIITETDINPSHANEGNLYSPANIIAIGSNRVLVESTLKTGSKLYILCGEKAELPLPWKRYEILDKRPDTSG